MRHPTGCFVPWICPVTGRPFEQSWTNHDKPECFNECEQCAPERAKSIAERLHELNASRAKETER